MKLGPFVVFLFTFVFTAFMFPEIQNHILAASFADPIGVVVTYVPHALIVVSAVCMVYFALEGRDR